MKSTLAMNFQRKTPISGIHMTNIVKSKDKTPG